MLHTIDGSALSIDRVALLDDCLFSALRPTGGMNGYTLTTYSAALSIGNIHADLRNSICIAAVLN